MSNVELRMMKEEVGRLACLPTVGRPDAGRPPMSACLLVSAPAQKNRLSIRSLFSFFLFSLPFSPLQF